MRKSATSLSQAASASSSLILPSGSFGSGCGASSSWPSGAGHVEAAGTVEHADKLVIEIASARRRHETRDMFEALLELRGDGGAAALALGGERRARRFGRGPHLPFLRKLGGESRTTSSAFAPALDAPAEQRAAAEQRSPQREPQPER